MMSYDDGTYPVPGLVLLARLDDIERIDRLRRERVHGGQHKRGLRKVG